MNELTHFVRHREALEKGTYRWRVDAYNSADRKLAESGDDIKFTIN